MQHKKMKNIFYMDSLFYFLPFCRRRNHLLNRLRLSIPLIALASILQGCQISQQRVVREGIAG